jgi:D-lactate dehydrogenase
VFYNDCSNLVLKDDNLVRLLSFPNVLLTAHQAYFTKEAVSWIMDRTIRNAQQFLNGQVPDCMVNLRSKL